MRTTSIKTAFFGLTLSMVYVSMANAVVPEVNHAKDIAKHQAV